MRTDKTLAEFIVEQRHRFPGEIDDLAALLGEVAAACARLSEIVSRGALAGALGGAGTDNGQGEAQMKLDVLANDLFLRIGERECLAGMVSEELDEPCQLPVRTGRGRYLLVFDPLDGSSNIDVNVSIGSIFSLLRCPDGVHEPTPEDFLQAGSRQLAAGYAIYGPATLLVLSLGHGVHGFTLDRTRGEFVHTHANLAIRPEAQEFAINASNARFWEPPVKRYVDECLAGRSGPREKDFNMRWIASLVAEAHRILTRGGVFLYPRDGKDPSKAGRLRLLYEANPVGFLIEQAGGRASTGHGPILDEQPTALHQRIGFIFGSRHEVEIIERYHRAQPAEVGNPLFATRGLFREQGTR